MPLTHPPRFTPAVPVASTSLRLMSSKSALDNVSTSGAFERTASLHRSSAPISTAPGRYHLYVSLACPWACGCLQALSLKGLGSLIGHSAVHPTWQRTRPGDPEDAHAGWVFRKAADPPLTNSEGMGKFPCDELCGEGDSVNGVGSIRDLYDLAGSGERKFTTPLLWDCQEKSIVSNESTDILRIFDTAFQDVCKNPDVVLYPKEVEEEVSEFAAPGRKTPGVSESERKLIISYHAHVVSCRVIGSAAERLSHIQ